MRIAICASEVVPFAKTGGLADVAGALPLALEEKGAEVIVITPYYRQVQAQAEKLGVKKLKEGVFCATAGRAVKVYFLENDGYFNRESLYGDKNGDYPDNLQRFSCYCRGALQLLKEIKFKPEIIHVHDWQASLIPVYLKTVYAQDAFFKRTRSVLTIHNIGYQGLFPKEQFPQLGLDWKFFGIEGLEFYDRVNILKGGMEFSDLINTVSPTYSREIQTKEFGFGLEGVLQKRRPDLFGIINGIDYGIWSPQKDKFIAANFSAKDLNGKARCKKDLQAACGLPQEKDVPLVGIVSRLAEQKGFDILAEGIDTVCQAGLQLVILGTGDMKYHLLLQEMVKKYPKVISLNLKFDDPLAHRIYSGADIFLMPSKYEPCGLGQLISLAYGTIPLVFKTGGLADTVSKDNGFVFARYSSKELVETLKQACAAFKKKAQWSTLVKRAMAGDFSWKNSAQEYLKLYAKAAKK
jgi:starch synthase